MEFCELEFYGGKLRIQELTLAAFLDIINELPEMFILIECLYLSMNACDIYGDVK